MPLEETLDDEGFFHANDSGYLVAGGRLFREGRINDIIKTGGANPLQRMQIIKVWDNNGEPQEAVYDIACSGDATPDLTTAAGTCMVESNLDPVDRFIRAERQRVFSPTKR